MSKQHRADLLLLLVTAFWGSSYYLMDVCMKELQPLNLNALRFLFSSLFLGIVFFQHIRKVDKITCIYSLWTGITLVFVYVGATFGVKNTSVSNAGFIISMTVVFTPLCEWVFFRKKPHKKMIAAFVGCVIGLGLLSFNENYHMAKGDVLCLMGAFAYALNLIITERAVSIKKIDPISIAIFELAFVGLIMMLLSFLFEVPQFPESRNVWMSTLFLAFFCTGLAFIIQTTQQRFTSASHVGLIYTFEPVFSAIIAFFFAGEQFGIRKIFGAFLMLISLVYIEISPFERYKNK